MKWTKTKSKEGDIRIIRKFLLFPLEINNEVRWLEWASIKQKYGTYWGMDCTFTDWDNIKWVN